MKNLTYTSIGHPPFKDTFWEIREMIKVWNKNMTAILTSSWITFLDKFMSVWTNRWTCPSWIFCTRKPHTIGNEYHYIYCGIYGITFAIELVEGNTIPKELQSDPRTKKTTNLLLRLCK